MKQKTEITFEIEETVFLRQGGHRLTQFCPFCKESVEMVSPSAIAFVLGISEREIFRQIEAGKIHFIETSRVLVCLNFFKGFQPKGVIKL